MSDASTFIGGSAPKVWVSGTTYAAGKVVWSPTDYQYYMRKSAGGGTTDPASDTTNWQPTGDRAIKSIQRGVLSLAGSVPSVTAAITSVNTAKTELRYMGFNGTTADSIIGAYLSLTNATTITAFKTNTTNITSSVSWELTERY